MQARLGETDTPRSHCPASSKSPYDDPFGRVVGHSAPLQPANCPRYQADVRHPDPYFITPSSPTSRPQVTPEPQHDRTCLTVDSGGFAGFGRGRGSSSPLGRGPVPLAEGLQAPGPGLLGGASRRLERLVIGASSRAHGTPCQGTPPTARKGHRSSSLAWSYPRHRHTNTRKGGAASIPPLHPAGLCKEPGPREAKQ